MCESMHFGGVIMPDNGAVLDCAKGTETLSEKCAFPKLASRFHPQMSAFARKYASGSNYYEDLMQEGLLGLYKAVLFFDSGRGVPFSAFALLCIRRQMITAALRYQRYGSDVLMETEALPEHSLLEDPESALLSKEAFSLTLERLKECLSGYEYEVLSRFLKGDGCARIAEDLGKNVKSVSNALARSRKKLAKGLKAF